MRSNLNEERMMWRFSFGWKAFEQLVAVRAQHREEERGEVWSVRVLVIFGVLTWLIAVFSCSDS